MIRKFIKNYSYQLCYVNSYHFCYGHYYVVRDSFFLYLNTKVELNNIRYINYYFLFGVKMVDKFSSYISPFETRYASPEMKYNFSDKKRFITWRKMWLYLASCEKVSSTLI